MNEGLRSDSVAPLETRTQILRLVSAGVLSADSRSLAILEYLLRHWHEKGPGVPIKAYAIAVDVLGRGADFDPSTDSIVRVEIGRLRKLLDFYHQGPGLADPIRIQIPRGQMLPEITRKAPVAPPEEAPPPRQPAQSGRPRRVAALVLAGLISLGGLGFLARDSLFGGPEFPRVAILGIANQTDRRDLDFLSHGLENQLVSELSNFRSLRVVYGATRRPPDYRVEGGLHQRGARIDITLHLIRSADQAIVWSAMSSFSPDDPDLAEAMAQDLRAIVVAIATPSGALTVEERNRLAAISAAWQVATPSAYVCYLHWQSYDLTKAAADETFARTCLKRLTEAGSRNGSIWAAQAFLQFLDWSRSGKGGSDPGLEAAQASAMKAVALDPTNSETHEVLASILLARKAAAAATESLRRAVEFNPSNPELRIKIGWQECLSGSWDAGTGRIRAAMQDLASSPGWYAIPLALDAFRRGDFAAALTQGRAIAASGDRRGLILSLAAARALGDAEADRYFSGTLATAGLTPTSALAEIRAVFDQPSLMALYQEVLAKPEGG